MAKQHSKSLLKLATALGVEPGEALRIAKRFPRFRNWTESTEAQIAQGLIDQLHECCISRYTEGDSALRATMALVARHGRDVLPVLERYRSVRQNRSNWESTLMHLRCLYHDAQDMPARFFECEGIGPGMADIQAKRVAELLTELNKLVQRAAYRPPPSETLGF